MLPNKPTLLPSFPASPRLGGNLSPSANFPKDLPKGFTKKNPSLPNFSSKVVFPANVLNIFPQSRRTSTLRIFKVKIQEDKEFEKLVLENGQKRNAYMHEIKRKDPKTAVEALVEKSKVDYQKKKNKNNTGSMYINDLWGKRYEVNVRRQARIDVEIRKEEDFKRKPIQIKLEEAEKLFEKKFKATKSQSQPKHLIPENYNPPGAILTERDFRYDIESAFTPGKTLLTEPREEYQSFNEEMLTNNKPKLLDGISRKSSNIQNESIATANTIMLDNMPKSARDHHTLPDSYNKIPEKSRFGGETRRLATEAYFPEDKLLLGSKGGSKKSNFMPSLSPRGGFELSKRKTIMEKQLALGDILEKCQFEIDDGQGWAGKMQEFRTVYAQRAIEKKKRAAHLKKEQEIEMYKDSFEKMSNRKKLEM